MGSWPDFFIVIAAQFLFFAFLTRRKHAAIRPGMLFGSAMLGIVFGVPFDLLVGKYFGVFGYELGFSLPFLVLNGALSYGLVLATVSLLRAERFWRFYGWTIAFGAWYELVNHFFPVWFWTFPGGTIFREIVLIFAAYFSLALIIALMLLVLTRRRFRIFG